jgi:multicomponent Na+:H+ antiporter subunit A
LFQLNRLSDAVHRVEVRDLRTRVVAVLLPGSLLVLLGVVGSPRSDAYSVGSVGLDDAPLLATLAIVVLATLGTTASRDHLRLVLALSAVGFGLAAAYALFGAPDVALVAVLIEITLSLLLLGTLGLLPQRILRREAELRLPRGRRLRDGVVAVLAGISATAVVWGALSRPSPASSVASEHVRLAPDAHAKDVVTAILADFRALDTLGEITVVAVALTAIIALLRAERPW